MDRPYRSHSRPACNSCRRRKSRCTLAGSRICLMCQAHGTECSFPPESQNLSPSSAAARRAQLSNASARSNARRQLPVSPRRAAQAQIAAQSTSSSATVGSATDRNLAGPDSITAAGDSNSQQVESEVFSALPTQEQKDGTIPLHQTEDEDSPHILGPAVTTDSHVLADYLSNVRSGARKVPMIRPMLGGDSEPVMFTRVQKRPVGMTVDPMPSSLQLHMIQKLISPWASRLVDLYFSKENMCLPLLDEKSFRNQFLNSTNRISSGLLSSVYAHAITYWRYDEVLAHERCPDPRFVWNLTCQILFSELRHSPGISTIPAILLNVGGRPTTSMIGNGIQIGSAVSLAYSLGINRNPLSWNIPHSEKCLRMKIWWSLLVHDRWLSLAYGTPPRLARTHYDVPPPTLEYLLDADHDPRQVESASIFIALVSLSDVLDGFLEHVYSVRSDPPGAVTDLERSLDMWVDGLTGEVRKIIVRGTNLDLPGASNLRLSFLSTRLLLRRMELNQEKAAADADHQTLSSRYMQVRRTAEDVVHLVQELNEIQLGDFWLPVSAFTFSHTVTFLIRCALETENTPLGLSQSSSLKMANDLLVALRAHQERHNWDLADICLTQHSEVIEKLLAGDPSDDQLANSFLESQQQFAPEFPYVDDMFLYSNMDLFSV